MWHPWLVAAQRCRKNCEHFQSIQRTNKTQKNCDETGNTLQANPQIRQKIKKKCSLCMNHIILKKSQFPARELGYLWEGENREKLPFHTEERFEQPFKCSGVLLIPISWFWWREGPRVYCCSTMAEVLRQHVKGKVRQLQESPFLRCHVSTPSVEASCIFYFYSSCSSEWLLERCDSKEGSNCSSSCWVYYLHLMWAKRRPFGREDFLWHSSNVLVPPSRVLYTAWLVPCTYLWQAV